MGNVADQMLEIIDKYEVPKEMHKALWEAYELGVDTAIAKVNEIEIKRILEEFNKTLKEGK
jgi:hypothetical protein